jgi:hypothetical protein
MIASEAVASLRPRPSGPPLRGRAPQSDGLIEGRPFGPPKHEDRNRRFHLNIVDQWSETGGRRTRSNPLPGMTLSVA